MSSASVVEHYNSHDNFGKINSVPNNTSNHDEFKQKLLDRIENDTQNSNSSFLDTLEELRREQRVRLARVEHDYYNQNVGECEVSCIP